MDAGVPGGLPEGAGEAEVEGLGFDGVRSGLLLEGGEDAVNGAEVGLVDDAGLAVDAFGDGDVEVGLAADDFLDKGCHGEEH